MKKTTEVETVEKIATEVEVESERRSNRSSNNKAADLESRQMARLNEAKDKGKGIAYQKNKKKEKEEVRENVKADLAAGKVPPFQIGGTLKSTPVSPPAAHRLGER